MDGPVLLLAVPGSGKTTVLVTRLGWYVGERKYNDDTSSLEDTIDSIFSDETGTESGTHPELPLESEGLNESDLDWF